MIDHHRLPKGIDFFLYYLFNTTINYIHGGLKVGLQLASNNAFATVTLGGLYLHG